MTERDLNQEIDLHQVKRVIEVQSYQAANELLIDGWMLHDHYVSDGWRSNFVLINTSDPKCHRCQSNVVIEVMDDGETIRYICQQECH